MKVKFEVTLKVQITKRVTWQFPEQHQHCARLSTDRVSALPFPARAPGSGLRVDHATFSPSPHLLACLSVAFAAGRNVLVYHSGYETRMK